MNNYFLNGQIVLSYREVNGLKDGVAGITGIKYNKHMGVCLEPQSFPDSSYNSHFPSSQLAPGEVYFRKIELHFKTRLRGR